MSQLNKTKSYTFLIKKFVYGQFQKKKNTQAKGSKTMSIQKKIEIDG